MIPLILLAFAAAPAQEPAEVDAQEPAQSLAFLEINPADGERWYGQIEIVTIRFGIEAELVDDRLISIFRRPLDLPVRLDTEDWKNESQIGLFPLRGVPADGVSFAWDGDLAYARESEQERDGTLYRVYEVDAILEHGVSSHRAGTENVETQPARLSLAYATAFATDFLGERVPVSEQRLDVESPSLQRRFRELPQGGLKAMQFSGVFGETKLSATITPKEVELGEEFQIEVRVEGPRFMPSIDLIHPAETGWDLLGELELESALDSGFEHEFERLLQQDPAIRRYRFDGRAEQAGVLEFAPFRLVRFDPDLGEYQQDLSESLSLRVRGATSPPELQEPPAVALEPDAPARLPVWVHWLLGAGLLALAAWGRQAMRQSAQRQEAAATAEGPCDSSGTDREPLEAWLAVQLGWKPAQLVDPTLRARLLAAGVPQDLAEATADFLQAAEATRYGGTAAIELAQTREELRRKWIAHAKAKSQENR